LLAAFFAGFFDFFLAAFAMCSSQFRRQRPSNFDGSYAAYASLQ
jgi:hypothetical protein